MAIIRSVGIGRGRKSAGNVTYRTVRGRTIASEKVGERSNSFEYSGAQLERQAIFSFISRFIRMHASDIDQSFSPTKYGSPRNRFMKVNYAPLSIVALNVGGTPMEIDELSDEEINEAVGTYASANPTSIRRVDKRGEPIVYLTGIWESSGNPIPGTSFELLSLGINGEDASLREVPSSDFSALLGGVAAGDVLVFTGRRLTNTVVTFYGTTGEAAPGTVFQLENETSTNLTFKVMSDVPSLAAIVRATDGEDIRWYKFG